MSLIVRVPVWTNSNQFLEPMGLVLKTFFFALSVLDWLVRKRVVSCFSLSLVVLVIVDERRSLFLRLKCLSAHIEHTEIYLFSSVHL